MRGFTLVEVIVAFAIAALVLGAMAANYSRLHQAMEYRSVVRGILASMHGARNEAERSGSPAVFFVDIVQRDFGVNDRVQGQIPEAVELRLVLAEREMDGRGRGYIRFYPAGGATGGSVDVMRQNDAAGVRLKVDWLFGRISQEPLS